MLIAQVYPVMKTYCLKGGTISYKGDVLNIEQDIGGLVSSLQKQKIRMWQLDTKTSESDAKQYNSGLPFFMQTTH
eukprot:382098-Ditylum_brightwellii.AAC.1